MWDDENDYPGREGEGPEASLNRPPAAQPLLGTPHPSSRCLLCGFKQTFSLIDGELMGVCGNRRCRYREYLGGQRGG